MVSFKKPVDGALYMFDRGFLVFPLQRNSRVPLANQSWPQWAETADRRKVENFGTANPLNNWGVDCGASGLIVLDIDNKKGKNGSNTLAGLEAENKKLPDTLTVSTTTGGFHRYFSGEGRNTAGSLGGGLDTRGSGGYVVAPGSRIDGAAYEIEAGSTYDIDNIPEWLSKSIAGTKKYEETEVIKEDVPEGERNHTLASFLGSMRARGAGIDTLNSAALAFNDEHFSDPLPEYEVLRTAQSISRYAPETSQSAIEFTHASSIKVMKEEADWPLDYSEFRKGEAPDRVWILKNWLPAYEISSLYGSGSAGKSLIAMQLGLAVSTGCDFLGLPVEKSMFFIGVFCEDQKDELHRRLDSIRHAPEYAGAEPKNNFKLWPRTGRDNALVEIRGGAVVPGPFMPKLRAYLRTLPKKDPKMLSLDTLADVYFGDENVREKVNSFIKVHIGGLAIEFNLTVLFLAHPSRTGQNTGDMLSGSTAWENAVRNRLGVENKDGRTVLSRIKSNYALSGEKLNLLWEAGRFIRDEAGVDEEKKLEELELMECIYHIITPAGRMLVNELVDNIATDPIFSSLFGRVGSDKRRREKIITAVKSNPSHKGFLFSHKAVGGDRKSHWIISEKLDFLC